jgi:LacI family transcriptional regulator, galactose operon repressor
MEAQTRAEAIVASGPQTLWGASIADVARRAGVSPVTVSRVVRNHANVSPATRERVEQAIAELGYIPNAVARGLKRARSDLIALVATNQVSPFFAAVAQGAATAARSAGLTLVLANSEDDPLLEEEYLRTMGEHRFGGVILVPTTGASRVLTQRLPRTIPVVLLDRGLVGVEADLVRCDTLAGTRALCHHLIGIGCRRIAIVGGAPTSPTWDERVAGYRAALQEAGLPTPDDLVVPGDYGREGGAAAVRGLSAPAPPDAIIAANDQVALGVLDELVARGRRVPDDVVLGSIDDPLPPSAFWPRLTVVEQPGNEMGKAAVDLLVSRMHAGGSALPYRELVFEAELKIGASSGRSHGPAVVHNHRGTQTPT